MRELIVPAAILLFGAAIIGDGLYNEWSFGHRCTMAGGITARAASVCVKPHSIINLKK